MEWIDFDDVNVELQAFIYHTIYSLRSFVHFLIMSGIKMDRYYCPRGIDLLG